MDWLWVISPLCLLIFICITLRYVRVKFYFVFFNGNLRYLYISAQVLWHVTKPWKVILKKGGVFTPSKQRLDTRCPCLKAAPVLLFLLISSRIYYFSLLFIFYILSPQSRLTLSLGSPLCPFQISCPHSKWHSSYCAFYLCTSFVEHLLCAKHTPGGRC